MPETLPPTLPDAEMINDAVLFINERFAAHVYHGYREIGKYVLEKFFNNDIQLAGSRNAKKPVSYYALCRRPDLALSRTALMDMVRTGAQSGFLITGGIAEDRIKYSLLILLTRLENNQEKLDLAQACIDEGLLYEELKQRIHEINGQSIPLASPAIAVEKHLTRVQRWIRSVSTPEGMTNETVINQMDPADKKKFLDTAGGILEDMSVITQAIERLVTILTKSPVVPESEESAS